MKNWKIGTKLLVFIITITTLLISVLIAVNISKSTTLVSDLIDNESEILAYRYANQVKVHLEESMAITRNLSFQISTLKEQQLHNRKAAIAMLKAILMKNKMVIGTWAAFEPNMFDGKEEQFKNVKGFGNPEGNFVPYCYKVNGTYAIRSIVDYNTPGEENEWYFKSLNSGKEALLEPYFEEIGGKKLLIASTTVPVKINGKVIGVVGLDISMEAFQDMLKNIKPHQTGFAFMVSNEGVFVYHPVIAGKKIVGTNIFDLFKKSEEGKAKIEIIKQGKSLVTDGTNFTTGEEVKVAYAPVKIGKTNNPWSIGIIMPLSSLDKLNKITLFSIVMGIVILVVLGILLVLIVLKVVTRPLFQISDYATRIARGELNFPIEIKGKDEIGILANSFREVQNSSKNVAEFIDTFNNKFRKGDLETKVDASKLSGEWKELVESINSSFETVFTPVKESIRVLSKIKGGDLREKIDINLEGDFNQLKDAVNGVHSWFLSLIEFSKEIAGGNMEVCFSKASEDDQVYEWLILMRDNLKHIVDEVNNFSDLATKGDFDKINFEGTGLKGSYKNIIDKLANTARAIKNPLNEVSIVMDKMAQRDLTAKVEGNYLGIYKKMKDSINDFATAINTALAQVASSTDEINTGSSQISAASQNLSSGATQQAASVEELNATMTELSSQTKQNSDNTSIASKLAKEARQTVQKGTEQAQQTTQAMELISNSSDEIRKIIKVIDDIAFQTNLLALNAAVEAARAGVHGKGFGVVADEVRNLAGRSAEAAKETTQLIEESTKNVEIGNRTVNGTVASLNEILESTVKTADIVEEITASTEEQAREIEQANQGLGQISGATQQNAAVAEETASVSVELTSQAENLRAMLASFKLDNNSSFSKKSIPNRRNQQRMIENKQDYEIIAPNQNLEGYDDDFGEF